jgi:hypothetical protein
MFRFTTDRKLVLRRNSQVGRMTLLWRRDTQHNDIQHNNTRHNDNQHNDVLNKHDTQHNDTQHNVVCF